MRSLMRLSIDVFLIKFFIRSVSCNKRYTDVSEIEDDPCSKKRKTCSQTSVQSQVTKSNAAKSANIDNGTSGILYELLN